MSKLTRKLVCLLMYLLAGCTSLPATLPFAYNQECPHICWLGINPGVSTMDEARKLLSGSRQFSPIDEDDTGFRIKWHTKQMSEKTADVYVGIVGESGIVNSVNFLFPANVTVKNFIELLGEPDDISVMKQETAEITYVEYVLYYTQEKVLISSNTKDLTGPEVNNPLSVVYLNIDLSSNNLPNWISDQISLRQPWLGFRKMDEYLLYK